MTGVFHRTDAAPGKKVGRTMTKDYLLALDQGTTSSRALLFTPRGEIVASAQVPFP